MLALGRKETDEPFNSEDLGAADRGRRPGRDRDRERPALPPAAPEGRRARPHARVQREHPRVARRRARGVRRRRADRPLEPRARRASTASRATRRSAAGSATCSTRRSSRRCAPRARSIPTARRCTGCRCRRATADDAAPAGQRHRGAAAERRRATMPWSACCCSSRTSPTACGSRSSCRFPRRWRRSACWPPASRTRSTRR